MGVGAAAILFGAMATTAVAAAPNWDTSGSYVVAFTCTVGCGGTYNHDLTLVQDGLGNLTGSGGHPAGGPHVYTWVLNPGGTVSADSINFTANYTATADAVTPQTVMTVAGTIVAGSMSGTWSDNYQNTARSGTWTTVSGTALPIATTKDQCKNGGWMTLVDSVGNSFKNQGDCVSFVSTKGKNKAAGI